MSQDAKLASGAPVIFDVHVGLKLTGCLPAALQDGPERCDDSTNIVRLIRGNRLGIVVKWDGCSGHFLPCAGEDDLKRPSLSHSQSKSAENSFASPSP